MIGAPDLLARAAVLEVNPQPGDAAVTHVVTGFRSRRVPADGSSPRLRYAGKLSGLDGVTAALEIARISDATEFAMLADILRQPLRGYPLISSETSLRGYNFIGSWFLPDGSNAIGFASVSENTELPLSERLAVTFDVLRPPADDVVERLERLYLEIEPAARVGDRHRDPARAILWLGESGRAGASGGGWKTRIEAITEARGLTLHCGEHPTSFQATHDAVARFSGDRVVVWASAAGPFATRDALPPRWRQRAIYLEEFDFDESLYELRLSLDEETAEPKPHIETWDEVSQRAGELEHDGFVLTEACRSMLAGNPYPDPARMWQFATTLSQAARDWRDRGGEIGTRLADWIAEHYEIEVAMHDSTLGTWTAFTFDGFQYSREPHVKVDDFKHPAECGRIYFAVDSAGLRFIVDYIGLHP